MSRLFVLIHVLVCMVRWASCEDTVTAGQIPLAAQTYDFSADDRCRIYAHKSIIAKTDAFNWLILESGFGSFQTSLNNRTVKVLDLNPWTVAFDLSQNFSTTGLQPAWMVKKPASGPAKFAITNHGGVWISQDGYRLFYQGGHFYNGTNWTESQYHVNKAQIPEWQLWSFDLRNRDGGWTNVTGETIGHEVVNRTFAGIAASVPSIGKSYWVGGLIDDTTSPTTPNDIFQTSKQMLVYDEASKTITKQNYFAPDDTNGYWQGNLLHLPIGQGKGYLLSLMSLKYDSNTTFVDPDGDTGNLETANPVGFDTIQLYDIEKNQWIQQKTAWYNNESPPPRTRFCSALFYDQTDNTWTLWVHGGQSLTDQESGVSDIYVLSMPSFMWTKVPTPVSETNLRRSHTCHAVGGQLIVVGGYPPALSELNDADCDPEYVKVLTIGEDDVAWSSRFVTNSVYRTPSNVQIVVSNRTVPIAGFANAQLATDFKYVPPSATPAPTSQKKTPVGAIAGGVVGGVVVLIVVAVGLYILKHKNRNAGDKTKNNIAKSSGGNGRNGLHVGGKGEATEVTSELSGDTSMSQTTGTDGQTYHGGSKNPNVSQQQRYR